MKAIHLSVLLAVCRAVDKSTGIALIRQKRIAQNTQRPRPKIALALTDLVEWGYLQKIYRGRRDDGRYNTLSYKVIYDPIRVTPRGDMDHDTLGGNDTVLPLGGQSSDLPISNLPFPSESLDGGEVVQEEVKYIVEEFLRLRLFHWPKEPRKPASMSKLRDQAQAWTNRGCPTEIAIETIDRVMQKNAKEGHRYAPNNLGFCELTMDSAIAEYKQAVA